MCVFISFDDVIFVHIPSMFSMSQTVTGSGKRYHFGQKFVIELVISSTMPKTLQKLCLNQALHF